VGDVVFRVFFGLQLDYFIAQKFVFERRMKMDEMLCLVSFLFAIEQFYCSRVFFEKRKKVGDVVLVFCLFAIELFYSSRALI